MSFKIVKRLFFSFPPTSSTSGRLAADNQNAFYLLQLKNKTKLTFEDIAKHLNRNEVWTASLFYGQQSANPRDVEQLISLFDIKDKNVVDFLRQDLILVPLRGDPRALQDPTVYRLNELVHVYGRSLKAIINEKFKSDGIMSSVDCSIRVNKRVDEKTGEQRVLIEIDGKYLPYKSEQ